MESTSAPPTVNSGYAYGKNAIGCGNFGHSSINKHYIA